MFENMFENLNLTDAEIATLGKELSEIYADRIDECGGQYVLDICGAAMLGALFMQKKVESETAKNPGEFETGKYDEFICKLKATESKESKTLLNRETYNKFIEFLDKLNREEFDVMSDYDNNKKLDPITYVLIGELEQIISAMDAYFFDDTIENELWALSAIADAGYKLSKLNA